MSATQQWAIGLIFTFIGLALNMMSVAWLARAQGKAFEDPKSTPNIGKGLVKGSLGWLVCGIFYLAVAVYVWFMIPKAS